MGTKPDTKALIATYRKAKARHAAATAAVHAMRYPDRVNVTIPEIGPRCVVYGLEELERVCRAHIANSGLAGLAKIAFQKQMVGYREVLVLLDGLYQEWRKQQQIDQIEEEERQSYDAESKSWKALLVQIKAHPRDIPEIARYLASDEGSTGDSFRPREALRAIAGVNGSAIRSI